eukprot:2081327-Rhodomonas_salina.2
MLRAGIAMSVADVGCAVQDALGAAQAVPEPAGPALRPRQRQVTLRWSPASLVGLCRCLRAKSTDIVGSGLAVRRQCPRSETCGWRWRTSCAGATSCSTSSPSARRPPSSASSSRSASTTSPPSARLRSRSFTLRELRSMLQQTW